MGAKGELADLGMTFDELETQARANEFSSEPTRLTWFMISSDIEHC